MCPMLRSTELMHAVAGITAVREATFYTTTCTCQAGTHASFNDNGLGTTVSKHQLSDSSTQHVMLRVLLGDRFRCPNPDSRCPISEFTCPNPEL